jgi:hypothetical protein
MRRPWLVEEIDKLNNAVQEYGCNWVKVSAIVGNRRSNDDCRRKAEFEIKKSRMVEPNGKRIIKYSKPWTSEEVRQLTNAGQDVSRIFIHQRTNKECMRKLKTLGRIQASNPPDDLKKCKIKICAERCIFSSRYCTEHKVTSVRYNREMADDYDDPYKRCIRKCKIQHCLKKIKSEGFCAGHHPIKRVYTCRKCFFRSTTSTPRDSLCHRCIGNQQCRHPGCESKVSVRDTRKNDLLYCVVHKNK